MLPINQSSGTCTTVYTLTARKPHSIDTIIHWASFFPLLHTNQIRFVGSVVYYLSLFFILTNFYWISMQLIAHTPFITANKGFQMNQIMASKKRRWKQRYLIWNIFTWWINGCKKKLFLTYMRNALHKTAFLIKRLFRVQ